MNGISVCIAADTSPRLEGVAGCHLQGSSPSQAFPALLCAQVPAPLLAAHLAQLLNFPLVPSHLTAPQHTPAEGCSLLLSLTPG